MQRLLEPAEIANTVVYLCSDLASATTGAAVRADGGYVDHMPRSLGLLAAPTRPRMAHESAPGIPCASCAAGYTYPIR